MSEPTMNKLTCVKCNHVKPIAQFSKNTRAKQGYRGKCKSCLAIEASEYRAKNADRISTRRKAWYKANAKKIAAAKKVYREANPEQVATSRKAWREANPEKVLAGKKAWRQANFQHVAEYGKAYRAANPEVNRNAQLKRRALKLASGSYLVTVREIQRMLTKPCVYCESVSTHVDHVIPLSRGGRHSVGNLIQSCAPCNLSKNAKFITEWKKAIMTDKANKFGGL